jgi:hypothetical protein
LIIFIALYGILLWQRQLLYILTALWFVEGTLMSNKDGFDPSITSGVQRYRTHGEWITVIHPGGYLERVDPGSVVLFETQRVDGIRLYWFGKITNTAFWLVLPTPVDIFEVSRWYSQYYEMVEAHDGDIDRFVDQGELPF